MHFLCSQHRLERKYQPLLGPLTYLMCVSLMSKESEGENSYLNRAANGCYRLKFFRDVKNSRTNYMFIYYANNAAYRRLAESF